MFHFPQAEVAALSACDPCFPALVENGFVRFRRNPSHTVHAAHIVDAVHREAPASVTLAVPIIASRVTNAASSSWFICPEPAGRSGNTR